MSELEDLIIKHERERAIRICIDMAERYDADIEGCDADELLEFGEGISCSFRLAYIIKYDRFPPEGDAWSVEFVELLQKIRKDYQNATHKDTQKL